MRVDWVPASAALLVTGAMALSLAQLVTTGDADPQQSLRLARENDGRWLAAAALNFLAAVCLVIGLPSLLTLFTGRGRYTSVAAGVSLAVGFIGLAGYAMMLVFFRALVRSDALLGRSLDEVADDPGLRVFLFGWVGAFLLGEVLLLAALLQAGPAVSPPWVSAVIGAHLIVQSLDALIPDAITRASVLLLAMALCGLAIRAARPGPARFAG